MPRIDFKNLSVEECCRLLGGHVDRRGRGVVALDLPTLRFLALLRDLGYGTISEVSVEDGMPCSCGDVKPKHKFM